MSAFDRIASAIGIPLGRLPGDAASARSVSRVKLPPNIVDEMEKYGRAKWDGEYEILDSGPYDAYLRDLPAAEQLQWLGDLKEAVVPVGGWACYGAATTVEAAMSHPLDVPAYHELFAASLDFQREAGVWEDALSINERRFWRAEHPGEAWQTPRRQPSRDEAKITPLDDGELRKVVVMMNIPDSNEVLVTRTDGGTVLSIMDMPVERGTDKGRTREVAHEADDLYTLFAHISYHMRVPNHWVDPELEPFFPFPSPRI